MRSPAGRTTARRVPTFTVLPAGTSTSVRTPATGEGISVATLSVSTSNSASSAYTGSPIFLYQLVTVPSATVSPSWGMRISMSAGP